MLRAILFDSDGVLVDTETLFFEATRLAFAASGSNLLARQWARWYLGEGRPSREIARLVGIPDSFIEETIRRRDEAFWDSIASGVPLFRGVAELLDQLLGWVRLAIVTGASRRHLERVHAAAGLIQKFELVVTSDDYEEPKPSPQPYLTALMRLGLSPAECLAVEDSPRGATAAISAGIRCLLVPTELTDLEACPSGCEVVRDLSDVVELTRAMMEK